MRVYISGAITGVKHADKLFARAEEKLEELKKEHPLVTNEKCFTLSWFPETIPSVLSCEDCTKDCGIKKLGLVEK